MTVAHVDDELVGRVFASTIASDLPADYRERRAPTRSPGSFAAGGSGVP